MVVIYQVKTKNICFIILKTCTKHIHIIIYVYIDSIDTGSLASCSSNCKDFVAVIAEYYWNTTSLSLDNSCNDKRL